MRKAALYWLNGLMLPALLLGGATNVLAGGPADYELIRQGVINGREGSFEEKTWIEDRLELPPSPRDENLVRIDVGSPNANVFAVDEQSVTYGTDEVIRYTLVVTSPGGVRNVSYEGMRCATGERRLYALGRSDGSWVPSRRSTWARIVENGLNRQHAALFKDYFCTTGGLVADTDSARRVLVTGNPAAVMR